MFINICVGICLCVLYVQRPETKLRSLPHLLFTFFLKTVFITFPRYLLSQPGFLDLSPMDPLLSTTPGLRLQADTITPRSPHPDYHPSVHRSSYNTRSSHPTIYPTTSDCLTTPRISSHHMQISPQHQAVLTHQISPPHQINSKK